MITPSFVKDYRNSHINRIWYQAELFLREATDAYIIGYSLPNDDLEVIHLLRRGLQHLPPKNITVVVHNPDDSILRRYVSLFGSEINVEPFGFEQWTKQIVALKSPADQCGYHHTSAGRLLSKISAQAKG